MGCGEQLDLVWLNLKGIVSDAGHQGQRGGAFTECLSLTLFRTVGIMIMKPEAFVDFIIVF